MIDTRLILIEGPPGSGKSTTARRLADEIAQQGKPCRCFLEWSEDHPIKIGDDQHLGAVVASSIRREGEVQRLWQQYVDSQKGLDTVTVMESRFWQTSLMLMAAAGMPRERLLESHRRVVERVQVLAPVLIYLTVDDLRGHAQRTIALKQAGWAQAGITDQWAQHIYDALDTQPWLRERGLAGEEGYLAFLEEWSAIAEQLYAEVPFRKVIVANAQRDWTGAMEQMRGFLQL